MLRFASTLCALALLVGLPGLARAQERRGGPPITDYDQPNEDYSEFWEQALAANDEGYQQLVEHARTLWAQGGQTQRTQAMSELATAIAANSEKPDAHFWVGQLHFEEQEWDKCYPALQTVYDIDPNYSPSVPWKNSDLSFNLASCLLYGGEYERAVDHFRRIISLSVASTVVYLRLGEALMALGRLNEATEAFEMAIRRNPIRSEAKYALAVAFDRAERVAASRELLKQIIVRDRDLGVLRSVEKIYAPAADEHYYLGLATLFQGKTTRALYHFRRYLSLAGDAPWRRQAQAHRDAIGTPRLAADLEVSGSASWNTDAIRTAIRSRESELRSCLAGQPEVLVRVSLSGVLRRERAGAPQVHAAIEAQSDLSSLELGGIVECIETAARSIRTPKLTGAQGSHSTAVFSILGQDDPAAAPKGPPAP